MNTLTLDQGKTKSNDSAKESKQALDSSSKLLTKLRSKSTTTPEEPTND